MGVKSKKPPEARRFFELIAISILNERRIEIAFFGETLGPPVATRPGERRSSRHPAHLAPFRHFV
jgi:hypothetical protein